MVELKDDPIDYSVDDPEDLENEATDDLINDNYNEIPDDDIAIKVVAGSLRIFAISIFPTIASSFAIMRII